MRNRHRILLLALSLLLVATFFLPPAYWRVVGWMKGESFYQARPTSYWEREVESYSPRYTCSQRFDYGWERKATSPWYASLLPKNLRPAAARGKLSLTDRDVAALPVLLEMTQSRQTKARLAAVWGLGRLGEDAKSALPAIHQACGDSDDEVRSAALHARSEIEGNQEKESEE